MLKAGVLDGESPHAEYQFLCTNSYILHVHVAIKMAMFLVEFAMYHCCLPLYSLNTPDLLLRPHVICVFFFNVYDLDDTCH